MHRKFWFILLFVFCVFLVSSCEIITWKPNSGSSEQSESSDEGQTSKETAKVTFEIVTPEIIAKPDNVDDKVVKYYVDLCSSDYANKDQSFQATDKSFELNLKNGQWTIKIEAVNAEGDSIGFGEKDFKVLQNDDRSVKVVMDARDSADYWSNRGSIIVDFDLNTTATTVYSVDYLIQFSNQSEEKSTFSRDSKEYPHSEETHINEAGIGTHTLYSCPGICKLVIVLRDKNGTILETIEYGYILLTNGATVRIKPDFDCSDYQLAPPTSNLESGITIFGDISIMLSSDSTADKIYYTLDGTIPNSGSNLYTSPIKIYDDPEEKEVTLKAFVKRAGMKDSSVSVFEYTIKSDNPDDYPVTRLTDSEYSEFLSITGNGKMYISDFSKCPEAFFVPSSLNGIKATGFEPFDHNDSIVRVVFEDDFDFGDYERDSWQWSHNGFLLEIVFPESFKGCQGWGISWCDNLQQLVLKSNQVVSFGGWGISKNPKLKKLCVPASLVESYRQKYTNLTIEAI